MLGSETLSQQSQQASPRHVISAGQGIVKSRFIQCEHLEREAKQFWHPFPIPTTFWVSHQGQAYTKGSRMYAVLIKVCSYTSLPDPSLLQTD